MQQVIVLLSDMLPTKPREIAVSYAHTEGEPTCFVDGLNSSIIDWSEAGGGMAGRLHLLHTRYDWLRRYLMLEPRGHADMFGAIVMPPVSPDAVAGVIWMNADGFRPQCGHGTIALGMLLAKLGHVPADAPTTSFVIDTLVGPLRLEVGFDQGQPIWCRYFGTRAAVVERGHVFDIADHGQLVADIVAVGNICFAVVEWPAAGDRISPETTDSFRRLGRTLQMLTSKRQDARPGEDVAVLFHTAGETADRRTLVVFGEGRVDRSPGGTGTAALLAALQASGRVEAEQIIRTEGLLGTGCFEAAFVRDEAAGSAESIIISIKGRAHMTGRSTWMFDPADPLVGGFQLA